MFDLLCLTVDFILLSISVDWRSQFSMYRHIANVVEVLSFSSLLQVVWHFLLLCMTMKRGQMTTCHSKKEIVFRLLTTRELLWTCSKRIILNFFYHTPLHMLKILKWFFISNIPSGKATGGRLALSTLGKKVTSQVTMWLQPTPYRLKSESSSQHLNAIFYVFFSSVILLTFRAVYTNWICVIWFRCD